MKYIGAHVSVAESLGNVPAEAAALQATAFAFNVVDPQSLRNPPLEEAEAEAFREACIRYGFSAAQILPHSAFVINLGGPDPRKRAMSRKMFIDELKRCSRLGLEMLNFHPGSHLGKLPEEESLQLIADNINTALEYTEGVCAVLENTAGQGSNLGYNFEQLAEIISRVEDQSRVGVCIDTAHAHAAGYDISTAGGYEALWKTVAETVGTGRIRGMHLNDSMRPAASRIDRHAPLGCGTIGIDTFRLLMADPRTDGIPLILETPDPDRWAEVIAFLKEMATAG